MIFNISLKFSETRYFISHVHNIYNMHVISTWSGLTKTATRVQKKNTQRITVDRQQRCDENEICRLTVNPTPDVV